ncbi:YeiH family protein [Mobilicoccus massiliensis]|uniref:YeiH family protein n=1 Tax=Mobilicoccus massiliensis TaxID=1522310 RepID=UPI0006946A1D|nr:putative sulfate exporter family transporter [Mobilicoccus massiliensis]
MDGVTSVRRDRPATSGPTPRATTPTRRLAPGLALATAAALVAYGVNLLLPTVSALLVAILIGVALTNLVRLPEATAPGLAIASKRVLRVGIVLLGLQVSLLDIAGLGAGIVGVVLAVVVGGLVVAEVVGRRLGIVPAQRSLIGAGFSICGAAAVAGVEGVIDDKREEDVVTALALVVLFGTLMIPLVPLLVTLLGLDQQTAGLWAGGSIHEVAQVVAAAGIIGGPALKTAVVVKLARVLMLAPVAVWFGWQTRRRAGAVTADADGERHLPPLVPLFVVGFLVAVVVRTTGVVPAEVLDVLKVAQTLLLAAAMFALGCGVRFATLKTVGGRPFVLATATTVAVALIALGGVLLVS